MDIDETKVTDDKNSDAQKELQNSQQSELAKNPNPRANENIREQIENSEENERTSGTGTEITDGEAG